MAVVARISNSSSCRSQPAAHQTPVTRRESLQQQAALLIGLGAVCSPGNASAAFAPPQGFRLHVDKLDGYRFIFPETWIPVTVRV